MYLLNGLICLLEVGSIASVSAACYAESFNLLASSLESCGHFVVEDEVCECDISALRRKFHSDSFTNAAGCTCYDGSLTCK